MRVPIFRVVSDDDPFDPDYPCALSHATLIDLQNHGDLPGLDVDSIRVGQFVTVGGGAAQQFTITRIR